MNTLTQTAARPLNGAELIAAERAAQESREGYNPAHDDEHDDRSLLLAGITYAVLEANGDVGAAEQWWPWPLREFNPKDPMRNLVRAGALIAAEIDRLQRAAVKQPAVHCNSEEK